MCPKQAPCPHPCCRYQATRRSPRPPPLHPPVKRHPHPRPPQRHHCPLRHRCQPSQHHHVSAPEPERKKERKATLVSVIMGAVSLAYGSQLPHPHFYTLHVRGEYSPSCTARVMCVSAPEPANQEGARQVCINQNGTYIAKTAVNGCLYNCHGIQNLQSLHAHPRSIRSFISFSNPQPAVHVP
jgi:hypothetical protein